MRLILRTIALDDGGQDLAVSGPNNLARVVHGYGRLFSSHLDNNSTVVETHGNALPATLVAHTPCSFQAIVERLLQPVRVCVPDLDGSIFGTGNDDGQLWVVASERDIARVALESGNQGLCGVVPNLDSAVV